MYVYMFISTPLRNIGTRHKCCIDTANTLDTLDISYSFFAVRWTVATYIPAGFADVRRFSLERSSFAIIEFLATEPRAGGSHSLCDVSLCVILTYIDKRPRDGHGWRSRMLSYPHHDHW